MSQYIRQAQYKKGFSQIILLGIIAVLVLAGAGGFLVLREKEITSYEKTVQQEVSSENMTSPINPPPPSEAPTVASQTSRNRQQLLPPPSPAPVSPIASLPTPTPVPKQPTSTLPPKPDCISNPYPVFTNHITDMSKVSYVVPPPTMGSGPSLKTHSYIGTNGVRVPIYAPMVMTLKGGSHYVGGPYGFDFRVSCEVTVRFGHITDPVDSIKKLLPSEPKSDSRTQELSPVSFAAGELIGYTTGTDAAGNWDFGVYNSATSNRYANDPNWNNSTVVTTAVCPFNYFTPNLKAEYAAKFNPTILGGNPPHGESFCL